MTPFDWKAYLVFADANAGRTSEAMRRIVDAADYDDVVPHLDAEVPRALEAVGRLAG